MNRAVAVCFVYEDLSLGESLAFYLHVCAVFR